jgi:phage antirepressor YoqD-like protein
MLQILQNQSALKMTTREIASLTEKDHSHVLRDAYRMLEQLGYTSEQIDGCHQNWIHPQNKQHYSELALNRDETLCLVAGYSAPLRMKIIARLNELESGSPAIPKSFAEALRLAADQQEVIQAQAAQIEHQKPAVEFVERYVESTGNLGFRQVCKLLKAKENDFRAFLQDKQIMYRLAGEWAPYAPHIDAGRFYVTTGTGDNDHTFTSAKFTPKGVKWISELWSEVAV